MTRLLFFLLISLVYASAAATPIRKFVDANGNIYYANKPKGDYEFIDSNVPSARAGKPKNSATRVYTSKIYKYVDSNGRIYMTNVAKNAFRYEDSDGKVYYTDEPRNSISKTIFKFRTYTSQDFPARTLKYASVNKQRFASLIEQVANKYQIDPKLVHAVIQTESAYDADAVSTAGAVGLMQLMPATARRFGVNDRNDPNQNVEGGIRYLKHLITLFEDNLRLAVAAYNAGENAVMKYNYSIPPYPETQNYVKQVLALYNR